MTIYTGNLDGVAGTLTTMLDSRLVALGWTIEQTGTNKRVYRNAAGASSRMYLRVDDSGGGAGGAKEALIRGGRGASDVDTITDAFPTSGQLTAGVVWRKSNTADATTRAYILIGDSRTFYLFCINGDTSQTTSYEITGFAGDFTSYFSGDVAQAIVVGRATANIATIAQSVQLVLMCSPNLPGGGGFGTAAGQGWTSRYIGGEYNAASGSVQAHVFGSGNVQSYGVQGGTAMNTFGGLAPTTTTELSAISLTTHVGSGLYIPRGSLRGLLIPAHDPAALSHGDTVTGAGGFSARTFSILKPIVGTTGGGVVMSPVGCLAYETSTVA